MDILKEIARVIEIEIEALQAVRAGLDPSFERAVRMIADCDGMLFVSGVGKSGIIAQKIAATLRSTGTQAQFIHAAEALHGDIGVVRPHDLMLAIGKGGESAELNSLLRAARKLGVGVISMTGAADSTMASLSDLVLLIKVPREACPLNLAPTASTTAALAVGDALAVALMKVNEISEEDFARHHPGGQLGRRLLLTVDDVMRKGSENPVIRADQSTKEMLVAITGFRVGAVSVVGPAGELMGLVTDFDIRKALAENETITARSITDIMNPQPGWVYADTRASDVLEQMKAREKPTAVMPVLNRDRKVIGMVHLHDLVAAGL